MGLISPQRSLVAEAPAISSKVAPPTTSQGVPGGANFAGRLIFEPNEALRDTAGYGRAGTFDVGAWVEISQSNPFVTMALDFITAPIADARVSVEPADKENPDAAAQAKFLEWALTQAFRLQAHNEIAARGFLLSGFSLFEPTYRQVPSPMLGRLAWVPAQVSERLPNSLDPNPWLEDESGALRAIRQNGPRGSNGQWLRPVLPAERVLLYSWKRRANNWVGESQLRSVWYVAGRIMPMLVKMIGVTLQREGAGLPVAVPLNEKTPDLTSEQRDELMTFFANATFHESSGVVMPKGWGIEWVQSPGANKGHIIDVINALGLWILQQLGAQQLTLGTGETGSRSVGEVHDARSMAFVRKVLAHIEAVLNGDSGEAHTGLCKRLIDWNFGPQTAYPRVKLLPQRPEMAPGDLATAAKTGKDAGIFTPMVADENTFRERMGFAPITEEERDAAKEKAASLAPKMPGAEGDEDGAPEAGPFGKKPPALSASAQRGPYQPWRPLRASERKLKLSDLDAYFTTQRERGGERLRLAVVAMLGAAAPALERAMADGKLTPEEIAAIPLDTARLDAVLGQFLAEQRKAGADFLRGELAWQPLRAAVDDDEVEAETDALIEAQKAAAKRRILNRVRGEVEKEAIDVMRTGGTAQEVVDRTIARQADTTAFKTDAGSVVTKTFNLGRDEAARVLGGIASVEYSAILDSATCEPCRSMDGRTAAFDSPEHDAMLPPNRDCMGGDNCRCLLVMIPERGGA
jgi:hypothetical protein